MAFIGLISYSLYLVHWPLLQLPQAAVGFENPLPLRMTLLIAAVSVPIAWLMYKFVEEPGRKSAVLVRARPRTSLLAALAASVAITLFMTGAYAVASSRQLSTDMVSPAAAPRTPPQFTEYVPANLTPSLRSASEDVPKIYDDGCHLGFDATRVVDCVYGDPEGPRIVLFGDSHAAQWFPALSAIAEERGLALEVHTKSSCPSVSAEVLRAGLAYTACTQWRDSVIDRINESEPAYVVISNYGIAPLADKSAEYEEIWGSALSATISRIDAPAILIADTPNLGHTPSVCLSANLFDSLACGRPTSTAVASATRKTEELVAEAAGVPYVDLTDLICSDQQRCDPIIGDTLVYRDAHHLTAAFSHVLAEELEKRLGAHW